jgi:predicted small lipoprotein YifL
MVPPLHALLAVMLLALACAGCGIKGPLKPAPRPDAPAQKPDAPSPPNDAPPTAPRL